MSIMETTSGEGAPNLGLTGSREDSGCVVCGKHWNNAIHAQENVVAQCGHHYAAHRCADCSRTDKHTHCAECGSTEHVASTCDMMG